MMKERLTNDCGMKIKDLSSANIIRIYNEINEYQKTGKLPDYIVN
jgi:hypothetical protein